jgi:cardiolipin synthase
MSTSGGQVAGEDRILTVPNLITLIRLACLPLFVWLLLGSDNRIAAGLLLGALGATDWVDGYVARRYHQVSTFGKIFDPVVDRLLFFVAVLAREIVISVATLMLAALGARRIDVTWFGKAGTFGLMFAFPFFLFASSTWGHADLARIVAWGSGIPALCLSYYAAVLYVPIGLRALHEGRAARRTHPV